MTTRRLLLLSAPLAALPARARAETAAEIDRNATAALARLYRAKPQAKELGERAVAILIFPEVTKAGLMIGGEIGYGALRRGDRTVGYYRTQAVSYGLQAGAQKFSYALFLMNEEAVRWLDDSADVRSTVLVPLRAGGAAFGLLVLGSPDPERFSASMGTDFLVHIGETASAALMPLRA